jgi:small conductance mechanosensitive channel
MDVDATLTRFFAKLTRYLILIGAVLGCLGVFGIQTASFAAVLAAAGFAVGMAFQGTLDESVVKALSK